MDMFRGYLHKIEPILWFRSGDEGIIINFAGQNDKK